MTSPDMTEANIDKLAELFPNVITEKLDAEGKLTVLKAGAQWEVLGVNDLQEDTFATPALADGRIYVRTRGALYCFGAK